MSILAANASPICPRAIFDKPAHQKLASQIRALETANRKQHSGQATISSGCERLDAALPGGRGYLPGTLVEWIDGTAIYGNGIHNRGMNSPSKSNYRHMADRGYGFGNGSFYLALSVARSAMQSSNKYVVIVDSQESFYPPAAQFMGIPLERTIVLRPPSLEDTMWSIDQSLRSHAVAAVVARLDKLSELNARRFQLAAEQSGALGLFLRPASARSQPSWSEVQWGVNPALTRDAIHSEVSRRKPYGTKVFAQKTIGLNKSSDKIPAKNPDESFNQNFDKCFDGGLVPVGLRSAASLPTPTSIRRIHLESLRMRGGRSGEHWTILIDTHSGVLTASSQKAGENITGNVTEKTREKDNVAASTSSMRLATELAMPASTRANTYRPRRDAS